MQPNPTIDRPPETDAFLYYWIYKPDGSILPGRLKPWTIYQDQSSYIVIGDRQLKPSDPLYRIIDQMFK